MDDKTKAFIRLEAGKNFNNRLDPPYNTMVDTNWEMFKGNQYVNSTLNDELPKPIFNVIKRTITFFVASLTSSPVSIKYSQLAKKTSDENNDADLEILNAEFENFAERVKLQSVVRDSYKDGAITGDFAWHIYTDADKKPYDGKYSDVEGELCLDIIDGANVYLGNPNDRRVQTQPYILVTGRDLITNLQAEYNEHNKDKMELQTDNDTEYQAGLDSRIEIEDVEGTGKATYVITYEKRKVTIKVPNELGQMVSKEEMRIFASKSVAEVDIYTDIETDLRLYPVVMDNWERQKNNYHGLALTTTIIPNQIFINRMFAMAMKNLQDTAFPKAVFDKSRIQAWTNKVGAAIGVDLQPGENINNVASYLQPGVMSPQIINMLNLAWDYTKEALGANDAMMGSVNPEQASGAAISVTAKQAAIPLTGPRDNMYDALEDLGRIFLDNVTAYYGERPVVVDNEEGEKVVVLYDFAKLKDMYLTTAIDVGATTPYDEMADRMTYESFLREGHITFEEYLDAYPDLFKNKDKILKRIKMPTDVVSQMSPEAQAQFNQLPPEQQQSMLSQV